MLFRRLEMEERIEAQERGGAVRPLRGGDECSLGRWRVAWDGILRIREVAS